MVHQSLIPMLYIRLTSSPCYTYFTAAFRADVSEPPPKPAPPEEIRVALNAISGLEEDHLLAAYDILVSDDCKFKSL